MATRSAQACPNARRAVFRLVFRLCCRVADSYWPVCGSAGSASTGNDPDRGLSWDGLASKFWHLSEMARVGSLVVCSKSFLLSSDCTASMVDRSDVWVYVAVLLLFGFPLVLASS